MSFRIGDPIFDKTGQPGLVAKNDDIRGRLGVDKNVPEVKEKLRHGYIKGLDEALRGRFNTVMDEVGATEDIAEKVELLRGRIREAESSEAQDAHILVGYLRAELAHLMHTSRYSPRSYSINASRAP